ncbi:fructose-bisphosphate aldolase-like protein class-II [Plenodomus tracheiphilus IPT5]|uniref:Fructose-bisphosphate aldolase n=1 Tax=Plenodomus tracheiphilus IPT5 TaxID=1408161 RepID=A0A6A7BNI9_9PLEO|nr:fructose-bisphosphate aldolase-like protein class-II [Plenodomus tracheiphilus IPT5]
MAPDRSQNKAVRLVKHAAANHYAICATCCYNVEGILASVRAAEAKRAPLIIQLFPWAVQYADGVLVHAAREAADNASVPVALHMDHAQTPEIVKRAATFEKGFDGIMVDMSHYDDNLEKTRELVQYCNERGIITEAEPGRIDGGEDGVGDLSEMGLEAILTTPEQAEDFVATGIDWLAPAFGNVHGNYGPKGPQLDYERLKRVHKAVGDRVSLVLHGAGKEWFQEKLLKECIECGVAKVNINDAFNNDFIEVMRTEAGKTPLTGLIEKATDAMQKSIEQYIEWMGGVGMADKI